MGDALAKSGLWQAERSNVIPPALCLDHSRAYCAAMKPAYRLFDVPRAAEHGVPADHFAANAARLAATDGPILIFQDEADFPVTARDPARSASPTPSVMGATGRAFFGPNGRKDPANPEPSPVQQAALPTPPLHDPSSCTEMASRPFNPLQRLLMRRLASSSMASESWAGSGV
jgi:hypothetical protein